MIDFRSVRVGNMLAYCTHPVTIQTIGKNTFGFTDNKNEFQREINNTNFTGIPLSPAILEKCGFEKDGSEWIYKNDTRTFIMEYYIVFDYYCFTGGEGTMLSEAIKYLHQLQNVVFSICSIELQITL